MGVVTPINDLEGFDMLCLGMLVWSTCRGFSIRSLGIDQLMVDRRTGRGWMQSIVLGRPVGRRACVGVVMTGCTSQGQSRVVWRGRDRI